MLGQSAACLSEDLYRDLRKSVQGLPETSVCVRDSDGNLNVYPPQDTIFKHAVGQLRFAAAIKVKLPTVRMLLQHTSVLHLVKLETFLLKNIPIDLPGARSPSGLDVSSQFLTRRSCWTR